MKMIEGIVERCAPAYGEKGVMGMYFLLVGSTIVYTAQQSSEVYGDAHGRPSGWNASLVNLTSPGDHISFESRKTIRGLANREPLLRQSLSGTGRSNSAC